MKVDRLTKLLLSLGFVVLVVGLFFYLVPHVGMSNTKTDNFQVPPLQYVTSTFVLSQGDRIEGYFTVLGGGNDINFNIKDPYASTILDAGRVTGRRDFAFTAEYSGAYTLTFDNSFSILTSKNVFLSYSSNVAFPSLIAVVIALIGLLILIGGLSRVSQAWAKEKKKQMANVPPPPPSSSPQTTP
jgi:hypothetical protein